MSEADGVAPWRAAYWVPARSPVTDLVVKALADGIAEPGDAVTDLAACDVAVVAGVGRLGEVARLLPPNVPLAVVPEEADLRGRRLLASGALLARHGGRVNIVVVEGDRECRRLAALRVRIPVATHGRDVSTLAGWLRRAHAYGYLCGRRPVAS